MLFVGTSIIHPSTEGVFLLCNILDLLIYRCMLKNGLSLSLSKLLKDNYRQYVDINYICLFNYLFISSQMSAKPYFIGSTGILLLW